MKNSLYVVLAISLITILGCATVNHIPLNQSGGEVGYAVISIGHAKGTNYSSYKMLFRTKDKTAQNAVGYKTPVFSKKNKTDFEDERTIGTVELLRLPAGEYEIYNFDVFENLGMAQTNYSAKKEFSIPFTIKPNEATYLGEYIAVNIGGKFISASVGGAYFMVDNKIKRDLEYVKMYHGMAFDTISNTVPVPEDVGCPLLKSRE